MDESWFLVSGQASNPYNNTGMHLVSRRCRVTSSDAMSKAVMTYSVFRLHDARSAADAEMSDR